MEIMKLEKKNEIRRKGDDGRERAVENMQEKNKIKMEEDLKKCEEGRNR
jgi:hypothetical protein